jgi:hypothetical protein
VVEGKRQQVGITAASAAYLNPALKQTPGGVVGSEGCVVVRHASARGACLTSQVQLNLNVDMTSNVKSCQQIFSGLHDVFLPFVHRKSRSQ